MNKLLQRIITAVVLLAVLLFVFFRLPYTAAIGVLGFFVTMAAWEWSAFLLLRGFFPRIAYTLLVLALMLVALQMLSTGPAFTALLWVGLAWWICAFAWVLRYPTAIMPSIGALCGVLVIVPAWVALAALLSLPDRGGEYALFVLTIVWAADIGAYFIGRRFGRIKLAPRVSPGKTWEGLGGGIAGAAVIGAAGAWWFGLSLWFCVPMAISVAAISVVGDLTVSMFKRNAGLKDSGNLFPGHGGVLDRFDSVTAAVPLFALEFGWTGLLAH